MTMTEAMVEKIFGEHLRRDGWQVEFANSDYIDIRATRGDDVLIAEVKGHTKSAGAALDIGYGQLLRRMDFDQNDHRYVLVVPSTLQWHAERVLAATRKRLGIEVFIVSEGGEVSAI